MIRELMYNRNQAMTIMDDQANFNYMLFFMQIQNSNSSILTICLFIKKTDVIHSANTIINKPNKKHHKMIDLGASIISSTISTILLYPAQRVKIQMQLTKSEKQIEREIVDQLGLIQNSQIREEKQQRRTIRHAVKRIYQKHGLKGFYSGLQSLVIGNCLSYGVYFVCYEKCKNVFSNNSKQFNVFNTMKSSTISGSVASVVTNPFWVLQTKQTQEQGTLLEKGKQLVQTQGVISLWKGLSTSLILVSNPIIQFVIYQKLKSLIKMDNSSYWYDLVIFLIGAISKTISTLITYPQTVIRTHQHLQKQKNKWHHIMMKILRSQGLRGIYRGIQPKLIQTVLNSALLLMLFQKIRIILTKMFVKK